MKIHSIEPVPAVFLSFLQWGKGRKLYASKKQGQNQIRRIPKKWIY